MVKEYIKKLSEGKSLSFDEARDIIEKLDNGGISDSQLGGLLLGLRLKGETPEEIAGFVNTLSLKAKRVPNENPAIDVCGTGGDGGKTFNISTAVAFTLASLGIKIAKHGNRAFSSKAGSIDVIEKLGLKFSEDSEEVAKSIDRKGIGFIFAPYFHPVVGKAAKVRKELGIGTIFNMAGPMLNPAKLQAQIIGVYSMSTMQKLSEAALILGRDNVLFYHGKDDGIDEISLSGITEMAYLKDGKLDHFKFHPSDVGIPTYKLEEFAGGDADENALILVNIFKGKGTPAQTDIVALNSAFALWILGKVKNVKEGFDMVKNYLFSGKVYEYVTTLREC
ncbi:MAG TPA: anthranilate phosphoribosyltransferase [Dictyoglomaceae bacterium]|nr:anthranilate phosphoribosyltransferase [Dictyoglomaceae bacterium]HOL39059.1 anthranilate phosphoribosyltransferase [Dictyoglomaceae bacterium]HOP94398.1 anthranilate phosphoribosyltransferase [Dictyoglomaceae bacterium]HPP15765.1 anthranilate phosphoribosyltransferase [Dictyoglomaceae bacterium]HPU42754.1 anthranilate phosphoribosyltransferase [Dictyoglomaceae bacterium]